MILRTKGVFNQFYPKSMWTQNRFLIRSETQTEKNHTRESEPKLRKFVGWRSHEQWCTNRGKVKLNYFIWSGPWSGYFLVWCVTWFFSKLENRNLVWSVIQIFGVFFFGPVLSPIDAEFGIFRKYSLNHGLDRDKEAKVKMYVKIINWAEWLTLD